MNLPGMVHPLPGLMNPGSPTASPSLMSGPTDWSQVAYQMAGSPKQGGMYAPVAVPAGTAPTSAPGGFANSSLGGTTLGILAALAKNPTVVKTLGSDVSNLFGGGAAAAPAAAPAAAAGTAGESFAPIGSTVTDSAGGTGTLFGDAPAAPGAGTTLFADAPVTAPTSSVALSPVGTGAVDDAASAGLASASGALGSDASGLAGDFATGGAATADSGATAAGGLGLGALGGIAGLVGMGIADFSAADPNQVQTNLVKTPGSGLSYQPAHSTVPGLNGLGAWITGAGGGMSNNQLTYNGQLFGATNAQLAQASKLLASGPPGAYQAYMTQLQNLPTNKIGGFALNSTGNNLYGG